MKFKIQIESLLDQLENNIQTTQTGLAMGMDIENNVKRSVDLIERLKNLFDLEDE